MICTVEEAKRKTCPMMSPIMSGFVPGVNIGDYPQWCGAYCMADGCMMWQWQEGITDTLVDEVQTVNDAHPGWTAQQCYDSLPKRGHCGLTHK